MAPPNKDIRGRPPNRLVERQHVNPEVNVSNPALVNLSLFNPKTNIYRQHLELVIRRRLSYLFSVVQFHQALVHRPFWIPSKLGAVDLICAELDYSPSTKNKNWKHSHKTNGYIIYCLCPEE